ncbi:hypothetical protein BKA62DRAFT_302284 [Auriculariales sp. MPI-PUGE-AT-0066]|nr:hypothetical protein BKA62DRAFT_302284 [Auriculariales sp. MPI-PUGE-AT-0066]
MRLSPVAHEQRDEANNASVLPPAGSAAALLLAATDPSQPAVAFGMPENAATCMPTTVWWYYVGNFPSDAACDIIITNVNVPQTPMIVTSTTPSSAETTVTNPTSTSLRRRSRMRRQQGATPVTVTLVHDIPIMSANHSAQIQQLAVPSGYYLLEGKSMNPASNTVYYRSLRFYVAETPDMSCLLSSHGTTSDPTLSQNSDSSGHGATVTVPASSSAGSESPLGSSQATRGTAVAGAVCGIIAVFLVLGLFLLWKYRHGRKPYANVDAAPAMSAPTSRWRSSRAVSFAFNVKRKPPPAIHTQEPAPEPKPWTPLPRTPTPAFSAAPIVRTASPAEHSEVGASSVPAMEDASQHVHFAIPAVAVQGEDFTPVMHQHPYRTASGISDGPNRMSEVTTSSFDAERADLRETFDLPITPMPVRQGFMSRTSSVGSSREVGPMVLSPPAQSANTQFVTAPLSSPSLHVPSPAPSAPKSARSNRSAGRSPGPAQMSPAFVMQLSSSRRS